MIHIGYKVCKQKVVKSHGLDWLDLGWKRGPQVVKRVDARFPNR